MADYRTIETRRVEEKIERDRWGRYVLPDPETGEKRSWTRATTVANVLKDRFALEGWSQRNIVYGMGQRPDLFYLAASCKREDDETLKQVVKDADAASASSSKANIGSAVHEFAARIEAGEEIEVPPPYDADVNTYLATLASQGIELVPGWIERIVIVPEIGVAGQADRLWRGPWSHPENVHLEPLPRIGDLKTSTKDATDFTKYGSQDIPIQAGIYANATHWWAGSEHGWVEMPEVDRTRAVIAHMPAGSAECDLYEVDIEAGWEAVRLALDVREWRKRDGLMVPLSVSTVADKGGDGGGESDAEPARSPSPNGDRESGREAGDSWAGKDGEDSSPLSDDPPAPDSPSSELAKRFAWLEQRVEAIKASDAVIETDDGPYTPRKRLAGLWSRRDDIPTFPKGGPGNPEEMDAVEGMCDLVEMEFDMPFGPSDPTLKPPTKADRRTKKGS